MADGAAVPASNDAATKPERRWLALPKQPVFWLAALLLVAAATYFYRLSALAFTTDEIFHGIAARAILETGRPVVPNGSMYLKGALFSYLGALLSWVLGSLELGVRSVSALSVLATGALVYAIVVRLVRSARAGLLAAFVWVFHPWTVEFARWGRLYTLAAALVMGALYALLRYEETGRRRVAALSLLLLALATSLYPFFVVCWLVFAGYGLARWASRHPQHAGKVRAASIVFGVAVAGSAAGFPLYGDALIELAIARGIPIGDVVGFTGNHAGPATQEFIGYSAFYPRFFFVDLRVFALSSLLYLGWTLVRRDPLVPRRMALVIVAISLLGVLFVTFVHLQEATPRYLFPIFPAAVLGSVLFWERLGRALRLARNPVFHAVLLGGCAFWYWSAGALEPPLRQYGEAYANVNFAPTTVTTTYWNMRSPVDFARAARKPGDLTVSNMSQHYFYYANEEPDFALRVGYPGERGQLAAYMSHTRELHKCNELDYMLRHRKQGSVWIAVNSERRIEKCLRRLSKRKKHYTMQVVFRDPQDPGALVYEVTPRKKGA